MTTKSIKPYSFWEDHDTGAEIKKWRSCVSGISTACRGRVLGFSEDRICCHCKQSIHRLENPGVEIKAPGKKKRLSREKPKPRFQIRPGFKPV